MRLLAPSKRGDLFNDLVFGSAAEVRQHVVLLTEDKTLRFVRDAKGVNSRQKVLSCTSPLCSFKVTMKQTKEGTWRVRRSSEYTTWVHSAFCTSLPSGQLDDYAHNLRIQRVFLKKNVSQGEVIAMIKAEYHVDVSTSFVSRLKEKVISVLQHDDNVANGKFLPVLQDLVQRNHEAAAYVETRCGKVARIKHAVAP